MSNTATLYVNGERIECIISNLTIENDMSDIRSPFDDVIVHKDMNVSVEMTGYIKSFHREDEKVKESTVRYPGEDRCGTACDGEYQPLAKKVNDLDLDDDTRLLRKYRVVSQDGTLTGTGSEVLLNVLFKENKAAVVKALKALEAAEKK